MITTLIVAAALALPADNPAYIWFVPAGDTYLMHLSHTTTVCCGEAYVDPGSADLWDFEGLPPMDFFNGMDYRIMNDGSGQAIWSYPLGQMFDAYDGPVGRWTGTPPLDFIDPSPFVWSGITPNTPVDTEWWFTCAGDFNGDGTVNVQDYLYILAHWGAPYNTSHFLDIIGNWGPCS